MEWKKCGIEREANLKPMPIEENSRHIQLSKIAMPLVHMIKKHIANDIDNDRFSYASQ